MGAPMRYQPQGRAAVLSKWLAKGLKLAYVPGLAFVNVVDGKRDNQHSALPVIGLSTVGKTYDGGGRAEFAATADANKGLTIISIWRSRASSDYLGADGTPVLVSSRTAVNTGWSYGRGVAIGGASNGNVVPQTITFQGVAQYTESNWPIESRVDTPVACRYDPATGKISWFRFGQKSSPDTSVSAPSVGGNLVFGAQGDYSGNINPWIDRTSVCLVFECALSDAEIHDLTSTANSIWKVFDAGSGSSSYQAAIVSAASTATNATGTFSSALSQVSMAASGKVVNVGALASAMANASLSASGAVSPAPSGALASSLANASMIASGGLLDAGSLTAIMSNSSMSASGSAAMLASGAYSATMASAGMYANGYLGNTAPVLQNRRYRWRVLRRFIAP